MKYDAKKIQKTSKEYPDFAWAENSSYAIPGSTKKGKGAR